MRLRYIIFRTDRLGTPPPSAYAYTLTPELWRRVYMQVSNPNCYPGCSTSVELEFKALSDQRKHDADTGAIEIWWQQTNRLSYPELCFYLAKSIGRGPIFFSKDAQSPPSTYSITMHKCFFVSKLHHMPTTNGFSANVKMSLSANTCWTLNMTKRMRKNASPEVTRENSEKKPSGPCRISRTKIYNSGKKHPN